MAYLSLLCVTLTTLTPGVSAQIVRGQVVDSTSGAALESSSVTLLDSGGYAIDQTLADPEGLFLLRARGPGEYRLRVEREGYRLSLFPAFILESNEPLQFMLLVAPTATLPENADLTGIVAQFCPEEWQTASGFVFGFVRDASTGEPVANARVRFSAPSIPSHLMQQVRFDDLGGSVLTGADGFYAVCGAPTLSVIALQAEHGDRASDFGRVMFVDPGVVSGDTFHPMEERIWRQDFELLPQVERNAMLTGIVTDTASVPIPLAEVQLIGTETSTKTNASGAFSLANLPAGWVRLEVRRVGFRPLQHDVELHRGDSSDIPQPILALERVPIRLRDIIVSGEAPSLYRRRLQSAGFFKRRRTGQGSYTTMEEYERRWGNPIKPSDVVRTMRGLRVSPGGIIRSTRCATGTPPVIFLDHMYLGTTEDTDIDRVLAVTHIAAIEVYTSATIPPRFNRTGSACGAIVIWTK